FQRYIPPSPLSPPTYTTSALLLVLHSSSSPFFNAHQSNASTLLCPPSCPACSVLYLAYLFIYITSFFCALFSTHIRIFRHAFRRTVRWSCILRGHGDGGCAFLPSTLFFVFYFRLLS
ncbi:hypothetical protein COCVIDRAFT_86178, partial [Bipolaris victoriae FI3]